ncbi:kinesin-like protein KIF6 [Polyodon spathula]|uniref:kinesin-like protein KIF6 n=1 Tax=Polyodon spathula TaxID=7913 RepID=UPI001B7EEDAC|nr:kinesin-like protein KIF6 [Polyodon spathula]
MGGRGRELTPAAVFSDDHPTEEREIQALKDKLAMVSGEQRTDQLSEEELQKLEERMEVFMEDSDPDAALNVGAVMHKIQHCFRKILVTETRSSPSSLGREDKLSSLHFPDSTLDTESGSTPQMKEPKGLLQQRDEITILVNMLKKEKTRAQDAVIQHRAAQTDTRCPRVPWAPCRGVREVVQWASDSALHHRIGRGLTFTAVHSLGGICIDFIALPLYKIL